MDNVPDGRFPLVEAYVGDPQQLFGGSNGGFTYDKKFFDEWDRIQPRAYQTSIVTDGGCITLTPRYLVENTRLSGGKRDYLNYVSDKFRDTYYGAEIYNSDDYPGMKLTTGTVYTDSEQQYKHSLEHYMKVLPLFNMWVSSPESEDTVHMVKVTSSSSSWQEIAPERTPACIRSAQMLPTAEGNYGGNWVLTKLRSNADSHPKNPSLIFEIETRQAALDARNPVLPSVKWSLDAETGVPTSEPSSFDPLTPFFCLSFADGSNEEISLQFARDMPPCAIYAKSKAKCTGLPHLRCDFTSVTTLRIIIQWVPPGYFIVYSNFLSEPWVVRFDNAEGKTQLINVPRGKVGMAFCGMGQVATAWGPLRYYPGGSFSTYPINRGFADILTTNPDLPDDPDDPDAQKENPSEGLTLTPTVILPYDADGKKLARAEFKVMVNSQQVLPSQDSGFRATDNTLKDSELRVLCTLYTDDTTVTPYIYRARVQYIPRHNQPGNLTTRIGDKSGTYGTSQIQSFSINTAMVNLWRTEKSGELTLTNNKGEWDHLLTSSDRPPIQQAIKIFFKWLDVPSGTSLAEALDAARSETGGFFDPSADNEYCILTGWMSDGRINNAIGSSAITAKLDGRFKQCKDRIIINSPFYDGTNWADANIDLLTYAGISSEDIDMESYNNSELGLEEYIIPMGVAVASKPQFKFKVKTPVVTAFDNLHNLVQVFVFETGAGKIKYVMPEDVINQEPITFYDTIKNAPDSDSAWQALSPFTYSRVSSEIRNFIMVGGPDLDGTVRILPSFAAIEDTKSIRGSYSQDGDGNTVKTLPENFIGYKTDYMMFLPYLTTGRARTDLCIKVWTVISVPQETVTWQSPLINKDVYTPVAFDEYARRTINKPNNVPSDRKFWLAGNSMTFDAASLRAESSLTAATSMLLVEGFE